MREKMPVSLYSVALLSVVLAAAAHFGNEPQLPEWFWVVGGAILPVIYQAVLSKLPGWLKFVVTWGVSALLVIVVSLLVFGWNLPALLSHLAWVLATMQAVYSLFVKPVARKVASRRGVS